MRPVTRAPRWTLAAQLACRSADPAGCASLGRCRQDPTCQRLERAERDAARDAVEERVDRMPLAPAAPPVGSAAPAPKARP